MDPTGPDADADVLAIASGAGRSPRKLALLNTAIALFAERGYNEVTIRDIGQRLGMTSAGLYWHYPGKSALLADAFELVVDALSAGMAATCRTRRGARERLVAAVRFHVAFSVRHRTYLRVYYLEARHLDEANRIAHGRRAGAYRDLWLEVLLDARAATTRHEAEAIYAMAMAMINLGSAGRAHPVEPGILTERTVRMLLGNTPPGLPVQP